jgi:radical SAM superfamily enzyme YgiQ (UPF0313 family)
MKRINILMIDLKSDLHSQPYQLGLITAYAMAEEEVRKNIEFTFSYHPQQQPAPEIAKVILAANAELVAMSNYAWNYKKLCQVLKILEHSGERLPRIVLGGSNCAGRFGANMMKQYPIISALVEGEGEPAFRDICARLADSPSKNPFINSRNCRSRGVENEVLQLNMNHRINSLDEIPSPYLTGLLPVNPSPVFFETNRGCPYRCTFCYWGSGNSQIHRMSLDRIREEMTFFAKNGVSSFFLADANFGIFDSDAEVAEMIAQLNAQYNYPFKYLSLNYAKNSSERVLQIASTLRHGKMFTATTLALQTVSPEAEKQCNRYAVETSKFVSLVRSAYGKGISTYSDLILGLPGESVDEFLAGLEAAISTGVPAIQIYQLSLLPGTEFYDKQEEFGLVLVSEAEAGNIPVEQRAINWDFLVASHPKMNSQDMKRGLRIIGIHHLLHNHNLGAIVNFYLARYGITHRQIYNFFDDLILENIEGFPEAHDGFLSRIRKIILTFAKGCLDTYPFEGELANQVWFGGRGFRSNANEPEMRSFMHDFYESFCCRHQICQRSKEISVLKEMIDYNVLVSPKPRWRPQGAYSFNYDANSIWHDMLEEILKPNQEEDDNIETWRDRSTRVLNHLRAFLSDEYLEGQKRPVSYKVENPMPFVPPRLKSAWAVTNRDFFCRITNVEN